MALVNNRILSWNGQAFIKQWERLELTTYLDQKGVPTVGYGHTGPDVKIGMTITVDQANALLDKDCQWAVTCVNQHVLSPLDQNQFDALVSFVFNIGCPEFTTSTMLKLLNAADFFHAAQEFVKWDNVTIDGKLVTSIGLYKRRSAERDLFKS